MAVEATRGMLERRALLARMWLNHVQQAGHDIETARYDQNLAASYIMCYVKGCKWAHSLALANLAAPEP